ncbi:hypothetical protein [Actinacidiphila paucisporea]|uniref:Uncharacterized protein n=1 Tax=Actinacidiphila paucisporea TaxID=310782 RepID=A0A1M7NPF7_9ACTN|nr:hypothetical protein [Actinacidiphila paucisporea]SHN05286.1 hypothetical protein SAMN05216499_11962 [Actinacidiphila paucisporea]
MTANSDGLAFLRALATAAATSQYDSFLTTTQASAAATLVAALGGNGAAQGDKQ